MTESNVNLHQLNKNLLNLNKEETLKQNYFSIRKLIKPVTCKKSNNCLIRDSVVVANALEKYIKNMETVHQLDYSITKFNTTQSAKLKSKMDRLSNDDLNRSIRCPIQSSERINSNESINSSKNFNLNKNEAEVTVDDFLIKQDKKSELTLEQTGINKKKPTCDQKKPQEQTSERPYVCIICKMAFKRNLHLKRHFAVVHTENKNFKCETCGKTFSRKDYLDKHLNGHQKKNFKLKLLQQGIVVRTKIFSKTNK